MFSHCPHEPDYYWDHEEDWRSTLKEEEKEAEKILSQEAANKRADLEEDKTLNAEHFKREQNEKLDTGDLEREIEELECKLKELKDRRAIERTEKQLATLRAIKEAGQKRPPRYER